MYEYSAIYTDGSKDRVTSAVVFGQQLGLFSSITICHFDLQGRG